MKKNTKIITGALIFFSLNLLCKNATGNFSPDFLTAPAEHTKKWNLPEISSDINKILDQTYRFLGKGNQAYVFVSEDGEHVLKLFRSLAPIWKGTVFGREVKFNLGKLPFMQNTFSYLSAGKSLADRDAQFLSYANSFLLLKEETGVEYLHLSKTDHLKRSLKFYDKIGILRELDLDSASFLLQKKTDMLYPTLAKLIKNNDMDQAKELLTNFAKLSLKLIEQGIVNPTTYKKNLGCIGTMPIQIDVGKVFKENDFPNTPPIDPIAQIHTYTSFMKKWLEPRSQELKDFLENAEAEVLATSRYMQASSEMEPLAEELIVE